MTSRSTRTRTRRLALLLGATGVAMVSYAVVSIRIGDRHGGDAARTPATSAPTVLGAVITPEEGLPDAPAASPVSLVLDDGDASTTSRPASAPASAPTTVAPTTTAPPAPTSSTEPPPTLVPPTVIENTTTSTTPPSTSTTTGGEPAAEEP